MVEFGQGRNVAFYPNDYSVYLSALNEPKTPAWGEPTRLKKGTPAWAVRDLANGTVCLVSYHTVVSVFAGGQVRHLGKWSQTTTRHQKLFEEHCRG